MKKIIIILLLLSIANIADLNVCSILAAQEKSLFNNIDDQVKAFLAKKGRHWYGLNVPDSDAKVLHEIILKHKYTRALEIGTSTGYSGIWIAWALAKTGGRLITIEIDCSRHEEAVANFREAGLLPYIDARLADAHDLVKELSGPFDFVFSDADKNWYENYFRDIAPKVVVGGCYITHNVYDNHWAWIWFNHSYVNFLMSLPDFETTFNNEGGGLAISYKKK